MTLSTESNVSKFLNSMELPGIYGRLGEYGKVLVASNDGNRVSAEVQLGFHAATAMPRFSAHIEQELRSEFAADEASVELTSKVVAHEVQGTLKPAANIRNVIAVASGKGGVGKSTVAANLALALAADGARVGMLDADIYGPSLPQMLGLNGKVPDSVDGKTMIPLQAHSLQVMSIGFLVDQDQPMVWRGPMVTSALSQLFNQTNWDDLDYLIVDMPPGTGDIQLTLSQQIPVSGAVIVTTPQHIATLDARKGLAMFRKVSIEVLGVIENMSTHICSNCGHEDTIFGSGGGDRIAADFEVSLLGQLPLDARIREQADGGMPTVAAMPESAITAAYIGAAQRMAAKLAARPRNYSSKFPNIVVEDKK